VLPPRTDWLTWGMALFSGGAAPAIHGSKDLLEAVVAGGNASTPVDAYVNSLAGLTYQVGCSAP
jgi:hypothetical protein